MDTPATPSEIIQPVWLRLCHWFNALAIVLMIMSGWRIYNASPLFSQTFPKSLTLGGWLGGALQWHLAAMWLFMLNGLVYVVLNVLSGRFKRRFWPLSIRGLLIDVKAAVTGHLTHNDPSKYNMVQKFAYISVLVTAGVLVLSGLVLWKSVQFSLLREILGGYDTARFIHFYAMSFLVLFVVVHLVMVVLVPKTLLTIIRGR